MVLEALEAADQVVIQLVQAKQTLAAVVAACHLATEHSVVTAAVVLFKLDTLFK
jgi:hypothetical protein